MTPSRTPVRDKLSINPEEAIIEESDESIRQQQQEITMQLREHLAGLPSPRNDFEIVMPEVCFVNQLVLSKLMYVHI